MDMKPYLRRWLNEAQLRRMPGDRYEGQISEVLEERLRNPYTGNKEPQPVIVFDDGYRLVPNIGMRQALITFWGCESEDWIGRRLIVYRQRNETQNADGTLKVTHVKKVMRPEADIATFRRRSEAV